ncbi:hypothetical protein ACFX19_042252 [Malus domestica]
MHRGVAPPLLLAFTLAPLRTKISTISKLPPTTAICKGAWPSPSWDSKSDPNRISTRATWLWPLMAAACRAVKPY